jgi:hypothetical protein
MCLRLVFSLVLLVSPTVVNSSDFTLLEIRHLPSKGRVQDVSLLPIEPQIQAILNMGSAAVPLLIARISSGRRFKTSPKDYWPRATEGDVALIILSNLIVDSSGRTTMPDLCWNRILRRRNPDTPAWDLLNQYVSKYGRAALEKQWRDTWSEHGASVVWDPKDRFFRLPKRNLVACA